MGRITRPVREGGAMSDHLVVLGTIVIALVLFMKGTFRYDLVAILALMVLVVCGIVPADRAFSGFGHPAVITVAAVLILSSGLLHSGLVDAFAGSLIRMGGGLVFQISALTCLVTVFSGFMNNVGALAIFMPVALRIARRSGRNPSLYLMPLAFGSLLGGMTTLIGTPPNIVVSMYRTEALGTGYRMFDFLPVGLPAAAAGVVFLGLAGWRLMPRRKRVGAPRELFRIEEYVSELKVLPGSRFIERPLKDLAALGRWDVLVLAMVRDGSRIPAPSARERVKEGDIMVVEADPELLSDFARYGGLQTAETGGREALGALRRNLYEAVVMPDSGMIGRTARELDLRRHYGVNLLGVARLGRKLTRRLGDITFRGGDILLLQTGEEGFRDTFSSLGCLPLAERNLRVGDRPRVLPAVSIFLFALLATVSELLQVQTALVLGAAAMALAGVVPLRRLYESVEWPVIVMLGALIPVGEALETTGGASAVADALLALSSGMPPVFSLAALMIATILLTNIINNAAAAVLMAPIALRTAGSLGLSPDPFLMAVAVCASAAFMSPVGHQSNTLVMGPGGYRFGDYWKPGLPLTILVMAAAIPAILVFWRF